MARKLPKIPNTLPSLLGPVPVTRVKELKSETGQLCRGLYRGDDRRVLLDPNQEHTTMWQTYWHEWAHIVVSDVGLDGISSSVKERICDAFANARVREMLDA